MQQNDFIQRLVDLGIAKAVDGYSASKNELIKFEAKYGISSCVFYDDYNNSNVKNTISADDIADWIFSCNVFISCGGDLKKFELNQMMQSSLECQKYISPILKTNEGLKFRKCEESEEYRNPRFYFI